MRQFPTMVQILSEIRFFTYVKVVTHCALSLHTLPPSISKHTPSLSLHTCPSLSLSLSVHSPSLSKQTDSLPLPLHALSISLHLGSDRNFGSVRQKFCRTFCHSISCSLTIYGYKADSFKNLQCNIYVLFFLQTHN